MRIHRDAGSNLAPLMSPHPIRQHEQPTMGTRLRRIGGSHVPVRVLVLSRTFPMSLCSPKSTSNMEA